MKVALFDGKGDSRHVIQFDAPALKWKKQNGEYLIGYPTGLPGPLASVFVKKWVGSYAPAHRLLLGSIKEPIQRAPNVFGHAATRPGPGQQASKVDHHYFMENLPSRYRVLGDLISKGEPKVLQKKLSELLIERNLGYEIAKIACELLADVNRRGYIYPDFTHKNIMIGRNAGEVYFIDVDSCFETSELPAMKEGMSGRFAIIYWGAWNARMSAHGAEALSRSMVLSFAGVWARAAATLRSSPERAAAAQRMILNPSFPTVQKPLWDSLFAGDRAKFAAYFCLTDKAQAEALFLKWRQAATRLSAGQDIDWAEIIGIARETFDAVRTADLAREPEPVPNVTQLVPVTAGSRNFLQEVGMALFSWEGRLSRKGYAGSLALLLAIEFAVIALLSSQSGSGGEVIGIIALFGGAYIFLAVTIKRAHDYNGNGALQGWSIGTFFAILAYGISNSNSILPSALVVGILGALAIMIISVLVNLVRPGNNTNNNY